MLTALYFHVLDDALFPELAHGFGVYTIDLITLRPRQDRRVPMPADSPLALLVSYRLDARTVPVDAVWQLRADGLQADGKPRQATMTLMEEPSPRDNMLRIQPDPNVQLPPGTVFRQVFWVDLGPPLRARHLLPGDRLTVSYGATSAHIALP